MDNIAIKCGESIELIQEVLEEIERKMPDVLWAEGESPASYNPKKADEADDGEHVVLFVSDACILTCTKDSEEYIDDYIYSYHGNDTVIYAEDFISDGTPEDIQNETDFIFV